MRISMSWIARTILASVCCLNWHVAVHGQQPVTVRYVSGSEVADSHEPAADAMTISTSASLQPNTGAVRNTFYFEQDEPLSQLTLNTAPQLGKTEGARYMPELDPMDPRTIIDIASYAPSGHGGGTRRPWPSYWYAWDAPNFFHRPLYFEQPNLERYGHYRKGWRVQSAISTAHFFAALPALPIKLCVDKPCEREYSLGHFRPGNCNPHYWYKIK